MYTDYEVYMARYAISILYMCYEMKMPQRWTCMYTHRSIAQRSKLQIVQALVVYTALLCTWLYCCFVFVVFLRPKSQNRVRVGDEKHRNKTWWPNIGLQTSAQ